MPVYPLHWYGPPFKLRVQVSPSASRGRTQGALRAVLGDIPGYSPGAKKREPASTTVHGTRLLLSFCTRGLEQRKLLLLRIAQEAHVTI